MSAEWALMNKSCEMFVINGLKLITFETHVMQKTKVTKNRPIFLALLSSSSSLIFKQHLNSVCQGHRDFIILLIIHTKIS